MSWIAPPIHNLLMDRRIYGSTERSTTVDPTKFSGKSPVPEIPQAFPLVSTQMSGSPLPEYWRALASQWAKPCLGLARQTLLPRYRDEPDGRRTSRALCPYFLGLAR